jgi:hypothetical protein
MRSSNLAERLEEFAATAEAVGAPKEVTTRVLAAAEAVREPRAPRRLSRSSRRIQTRDPGLRHFRVF